MKRYHDNWVDPIKDKVAQEYYNCVNYEEFLNSTSWRLDEEVDMFMNLVAREYSKQVERYYTEEND